MERWRVEDLARRAEVSVDTIRFYQKRHLLAPPAREGRVAWYGPEHLERLARIRELQGQGLTLALIERLLAGEIDATDVPLAAAVASAAADTGAREEFLTLPELAALAREHTAATRDIAEQAVALFDEHVRQPLRTSDLPDDEKAEALVAAFRVLLPTITTLVAHHFRRVLLAVAQEHLERVGEDTELAAVSEAAAGRLEDGFLS
jgi:DNA-binding transcriptional MerR regulator